MGTSLRRKDAEIFMAATMTGVGHFSGSNLTIVHATTSEALPGRMPGALIYTLYDIELSRPPRMDNRKERGGCLRGVERAVTLATNSWQFPKATSSPFQALPTWIHTRESCM